MDLDGKVPDAFSLAAKSRKLHYSFSYKMLPLMLFGEHGQDVFDVLADAAASGPYLHEAWDRTATSQALERFEPEGLRAEFREGARMDSVIVYMPPPLYPPEAYYVIVQREHDTQKLHFFTVEYSVRLDGSHRVVLGKVKPGGVRYNLGALPTAQIDNCLDEIDRRKAHTYPVN